MTKVRQKKKGKGRRLKSVGGSRKGQIFFQWTEKYTLEYMPSMLNLKKMLYNKASKPSYSGVLLTLS